jgi:predicted membrane protein
MLLNGDGLKIVWGVVEGVAVDVVYKVTHWNWPIVLFPYVTMEVGELPIDKALEVQSVRAPF